VRQGRKLIVPDNVIIIIIITFKKGGLGVLPVP
jgi:hypothetical protein